MMLIRPEQRDLAQTLFEGALERKPEERATYLANACPGDPELRDCILRMLAIDEKDTAFLETPALAQILTSPLFAEGDVVDGRFHTWIERDAAVRTANRIFANKTLTPLPPPAPFVTAS